MAMARVARVRKNARCLSRLGLATLLDCYATLPARRASSVASRSRRFVLRHLLLFPVGLGQVMASAFSSPRSPAAPRASRPPPRRRLALRPARALPPPAATSPEGIPPPPTFPNPLGVHALVWTGGWSEPECRAACEGTAKTGYDLVEIPLLDPSSVDPDMTRRVLAEHDLRATTSLGLSFDADVSSPDEAIAKRGEALLDAALDVTAGMGAFAHVRRALPRRSANTTRRATPEATTTPFARFDASHDARRTRTSSWVWRW